MSLLIISNRIIPVKCMIVVLSALMTSMVFQSCLSTDKKGLPSSVLNEYVTRSFSIKDFKDKAGLVVLTTGEVKKTLEALDEAAFKYNFVEQKKELVSLKIKDERKLDENKYSITYEVAYVSKMSAGLLAGLNGGPKQEAQENIDNIVNKKHAIFEKQGDQWLLSEVKNLKTTIEHQNALSL